MFLYGTIATGLGFYLLIFPSVVSLTTTQRAWDPGPCFLHGCKPRARHSNNQFNEGINDIFQLRNWPTPWSGWTSTKCGLNRVTSLHDIFTGLSRTGENLYKRAQVTSTLKQARRRNPRDTSQQALLGRCWAHLSPVTFGGSSIPSWLLGRERSLSRLYTDTPLPRK